MTSSPNSIELMLVKPLNGCVLAVDVKSAQFAAFHFTLINTEQPKKALLPIEVIDLGMVIDVIDLLLLNAEAEIVRTSYDTLSYTTVSGMTTSPLHILPLFTLATPAVDEVYSIPLTVKVVAAYTVTEIQNKRVKIK